MPARAPAWRNRITGHGEVAPDELLANPRNWRVHPKHQQDALKGVLDQVGFVQSVMVNKRSGFVVDGHARIALAISKQQPTVPVVYVDLDDHEEGMVLATLDPISALAGSDSDQLAALLEGLQPADEAVANLLRELAPPRAKELNPDDADLTPPDEPITKPGDLWLLGEHRLLCGDATKREDIDRLLAGRDVALVLTDPPYNVAFDYGETTDDDRADYREWCASWFGIAQQIAPRVVLTVGVVNLSMWLADTSPAHVGVWTKGEAATAHSKVTQFVGWEPIMFYGDGKWPRRRHMDVFDYNAGSVPRLDHPCPKPVTLWGDLIESCSEVSDVVTDLFAGTGTGIVAAEQSNRLCYMLEISPAYCDVIVRRWERVSGRQAVKANA